MIHIRSFLAMVYWVRSGLEADEKVVVSLDRPEVQPGVPARVEEEVLK